MIHSYNYFQNIQVIFIQFLQNYELYRPICMFLDMDNCVLFL